MEESEPFELCGHPERVLAFKRGDRQVLDKLYRAYRQDVYRVLAMGFSFTSDGKTMRFQGFAHEPFQCQELLQDCFLRAFRQNARERYDGARPWRPYLMAIVRSQVIDHFRKSRAARRHFVAIQDSVKGALDENSALERLQQESYDDAANPEQEAIRAHLQRSLQTFFATLSEEDRTLLDRHLLGDLSQAQFAEEMDLSRNDVRKQIRELRASLLRHLKSESLIPSLDIQDLLQTLLLFLFSISR